jgi:hypothetical protein
MHALVLIYTGHEESNNTYSPCVQEIDIGGSVTLTQSLFQKRHVCSTARNVAKNVT